ncbi:salicylic acid-binding protein 2-like [Macadamia integrifolia]|uniref:salicylic acid-binding protein 2-like n=1 Tax=Macadamia integrifolia TaxID=60698 RepID=UPI001C5327C5|nr:salicylic acid-binding protein 2-like [Macadamia integrifolia]
MANIFLTNFNVMNRQSTRSSCRGKWGLARGREREREMVHFVLVHGLGHGGWCWYKVKPLLESAGHQVTAIDLAASGINMAKLAEVHTMSNYSQPLMELMDSLPPGEKVTLVGHSLGGYNLAIAMDRFPHKISVAVFLTAFMPDSTHSPSYVLDQFMERIPAEGCWLDTHFSSDLDPVMPKTTVLFGPKFLAFKLYQLSSSQDLALGETLVRPGSMFIEDLSKGKAFSKEGYGSVNRVYIVCKKDLVITEDFQRWMIENDPLKEVMEIEDADHMAMLSKPNELCFCLLDIANKYN